MGILNQLTIKHLKMNPKRTMMTIIGILLSTALMVGIGLIFSSILEYEIEGEKERSGSYYAFITDVDKTTLPRLKDNVEVIDYAYSASVGYAKYAESENSYKPYFHIKKVNESYLKELKLIEGRYPKNDSEILLSNHIYEQGESNLKVGDTVTFEIGKRMLDGKEVMEEAYTEGETLEVTESKTYRVVGIVNRASYTYESYSSSGFYLFTLDQDDTKENVLLYLKYKHPGKSIEITKAIYPILKGNDYYYESEVSYNTSLLILYGTSIYSNYNRAMRSILILFLSIVSIACTVVIYNSFAISVMERKKQFGLFTSIGATKSQIRKTVFFEAFIVGAIGIVLGIFSAYLGIGVTGMIINSLLGSMLERNLKLTTYPFFLIVPIIFVILVVFLSAYLPARRASKISPIEVIRQNDDIKINRKKIKTKGWVNKLFGMEAEIAYKNMKRNKKKYRITVLSLIVSIATFLAFSTYLNYGKQLVKDNFDIQDYDIYMSSYPSSYSSENIQRISSIFDEFEHHPDVDEYMRYTSYGVYLDNIPKQNYTKEYLSRVSYGEDYYSPYYMEVIVLPDNLYQQYQKEIGMDSTSSDYILVNRFKYMEYTDSSRKVVSYQMFDPKTELSLRICHFDEDMRWEQGNSYEELRNEKCGNYFSNIFFTDKTPNMISQSIMLVLNESQKEKLLKEESTDAEYLFIKSKNYLKLDELAEKYKNEKFYYENYIETSKQERNLLLVIEILLYGFITLVTLIGITSVFNTIHTSINLRRREFAMLRSIGLTPKGFNKMLAFESIFLGLKALLFGLPIGLGLGYLICDEFSEISTMVYAIPIKAILFVIIGIFLVILITMWYATRNMKKENILEAIREENI